MSNFGSNQKKVPTSNALMSSFHRQQQSTEIPLTVSTQAIDNQLNSNANSIHYHRNAVASAKQSLAHRDPNIGVFPRPTTINIESAPSGLFSQVPVVMPAMPVATSKSTPPVTEHNPPLQPYTSTNNFAVTPQTPLRGHDDSDYRFPAARGFLLAASTSSFSELIARETFVGETIKAIQRIAVEESVASQVSQIIRDREQDNAGTDEDNDNAQERIDVVVKFCDDEDRMVENKDWMPSPQRPTRSESDNAHSPARRCVATNAATTVTTGRHPPTTKASHYFLTLSELERSMTGEELTTSSSKGGSASQPLDALLNTAMDRLNRFVVSKDGSLTTQGPTPKNGYDVHGVWHQYLQALTSIELTKEMVAEGPATFEALMVLIGGGNINLLGPSSSSVAESVKCVDDSGGLDSSATKKSRTEKSRSVDSTSSTNQRRVSLVEMNRTIAIESAASANICNIPHMLMKGTLPSFVSSAIATADTHSRQLGTQMPTDNDRSSIGNSLSVSKRVAIQHMGKALMDNISARSAAKILQTSAPPQLWLSSFFGVNFLRAGTRVCLHSTWSTSVIAADFVNMKFPYKNIGTSTSFAKLSRTSLCETIERALQAERNLLKVSHQRRELMSHPSCLSHLVSCGSEIFIRPDDGMDPIQARRAFCLQPDPRGLSSENSRLLPDCAVTDDKDEDYRDWHYPAHSVGPHYQYNLAGAGAVDFHGNNSNIFVPAATSITACREMSELRMLSEGYQVPSEGQVASAYLSPIDVTKGPSEPRRSVVSSVVTMANYLYPVVTDEGLFYTRYTSSTASLSATTGPVTDLKNPRTGLSNSIVESTNTSINQIVSPFALCRGSLTTVMSDPEVISVFQSDLRPHMRVVLADWLTEVAVKYKFDDETFFLSLSIVDAYLSKRGRLSRNDLQLVGSAALMIAAKFEEVYPPCSADFVHITDRAFAIDDLLETELSILNILRYKVSFPSVLMFAQSLLAAASTAAESKGNNGASVSGTTKQALLERAGDLSEPLSREKLLLLLKRAAQTADQKGSEKLPTATVESNCPVNNVARSLQMADDNDDVFDPISHLDTREPTQTEEEPTIAHIATSDASQWPPIESILESDLATLNNSPLFSTVAKSSIISTMCHTTEPIPSDIAKSMTAAGLALTCEELVYPLELRTRALVLSPQCLSYITSAESKRSELTAAALGDHHAGNPDGFPESLPMGVARRTRYANLSNTVNDMTTFGKLLRGITNEKATPTTLNDKVDASTTQTAVSGPLRISVSDIARHALGGLARRISHIRRKRRETLVSELIPIVTVELGCEGGNEASNMGEAPAEALLLESQFDDTALSPQKLFTRVGSQRATLRSPSTVRAAVSLPRRRKQCKALEQSGLAIAVSVSPTTASPALSRAPSNGRSSTTTAAFNTANTPSRRKQARKSINATTVAKAVVLRNSPTNKSLSSKRTSPNGSNSSSLERSAGEMKILNTTQRRRTECMTELQSALSRTTVAEATSSVETLLNLQSSTAKSGLGLMMKRYYANEGQWRNCRGSSSSNSAHTNLAPTTVSFLASRGIVVSATYNHKPQFDYVLTSQLASGTHLEHSMVLYLCYLTTVRTCYGEVALPSTVATAIVAIARLWAGEVLFDVNTEGENSMASDIQMLDWATEVLEDELANHPCDSAESGKLEHEITLISHRRTDVEYQAKAQSDFQMVILFPTAAIRDAAAHIVTLLLNERAATHLLVCAAHRASEDVHTTDVAWLNEQHLVSGVANALSTAAEALKQSFVASGLGTQADMRDVAAHTTPSVENLNRFTAPCADSIMTHVTEAIADAQDMVNEDEARRNGRNAAVPKTGVFTKFISRRFDSVSLLPVSPAVSKLANKIEYQ